MRAQINEFATRPSEIFHERKKYFLICEGACTEPDYFKGISKNKKILSINESISLINILRDIDDYGNSHPIQLLKLVDEFILGSENNYINVDSFKKIICDYIRLNYSSHEKDNIIKQVNDYFKGYLNEIINFSSFGEIIIDIFKEIVFENIVFDITKYMNEQRVLLDYNKETDVLNLIIDRDKHSFKSEKYFEFLEKCQHKNINVIVSNPCFEVWLLMHFEEFDSLDQDKLLENNRIGGSKRAKKYSEKSLSDVLQGYSKEKLNFDKFLPLVNKAILKSKEYATNPVELENHVGSMVGELLEKMKHE